MENDMATKIAANPKYQKLVRTRSSFGWILTAIMMFVYYGYIALIAFNKESLAARLGEGVMTVGIPVGFGVIVFTILITGEPLAKVALREGFFAAGGKGGGGGRPFLA